MAHWPVSLGLLLPFALVVAARGLWLWARERRAVRRALRELLGPRR